MNNFTLSGKVIRKPVIKKNADKFMYCFLVIEHDQSLFKSLAHGKIRGFEMSFICYDNLALIVSQKANCGDIVVVSGEIHVNKNETSADKRTRLIYVAKSIVMPERPSMKDRIVYTKNFDTPNEVSRD